MDFNETLKQNHSFKLIACTSTKRHLEVIQQNSVTMKLLNKTYCNMFLYYEQMYNRKTQLKQKAPFYVLGVHNMAHFIVECGCPVNPVGGQVVRKLVQGSLFVLLQLTKVAL